VCAHARACAFETCCSFTPDGTIQSAGDIIGTAASHASTVMRVVAPTAAR
jgi:hypothetical protein